MADETPDAVSFGLLWHIRPSLRQYLELAGGTIRATRGAAMTTDGGVYFPCASHLPPHTDRSAAFCGTVDMSAHMGMLAILLNDPALSGGAQAQTLSFATASSGLGHAPVLALRLQSAVFDGVLELWDDDAHLHPAAVSLFGDAYEALTPMGSIRIRVPVPSAD